MKQTILLLLLLLTRLCSAETFYIPAANIADHGNAEIPHSIAWHFNRHGAGHTFVLTTPDSEATYWLATPLSLPPGSTLLGQEENRGVSITANTLTPLPFMLRMNYGTTVENLTLDGNEMSRSICVVAGDSVTIRDNTLQGATEYGITTFDTLLGHSPAGIPTNKPAITKAVYRPRTYEAIGTPAQLPVSQPEVLQLKDKQGEIIRTYQLPPIPKGFKLQVFYPQELGMIGIVPEHWHFHWRHDGDEVVNFTTKENMAVTGHYKTGMKITHQFAVSEHFNVSAAQLAALNLAAIREEAVRVYSDQEDIQHPAMQNHGLRVVSKVPGDGGDTLYFIVYKYSWNDEADWLMVSTFGVPIEEAEQVLASYEVMIDFEKQLMTLNPG